MQALFTEVLEQDSNTVHYRWEKNTEVRNGEVQTEPRAPNEIASQKGI